MCRAVRIISWNVNGLRALLKKNFCEAVYQMQPDILCLQEIKLSENDIPEVHLPGYVKIFNPSQRRGYAGTAVFSRIPLKSVNCDTHFEKFTEVKEGRVILVDYEKFFLVNVYTPNSGVGLVRLHLRHKIWDVEMLQMLQRLKKNKPVIFCGDMNVAYSDIDLSHPENNHFSAGFTDEEREGMSNYLKNFGVDTFRKLYPNKPECYSWWSYRTRARERNVGWRIDYVIVDNSSDEKVKNAFIEKEILGSDHAPVGIDISL